jgi:hypothetical protein
MHEMNAYEAYHVCLPVRAYESAQEPLERLDEIFMDIIPLGTTLKTLFHFLQLVIPTDKQTDKLATCRRH